MLSPSRSYCRSLLLFIIHFIFSLSLVHFLARSLSHSLSLSLSLYHSLSRARCLSLPPALVLSQTHTLPLFFAVVVFSVSFSLFLVFIVLLLSFIMRLCELLRTRRVFNELQVARFLRYNSFHVSFFLLLSASYSLESAARRTLVSRVRSIPYSLWHFFLCLFLWRLCWLFHIKKICRAFCSHLFVFLSFFFFFSFALVSFLVWFLFFMCFSPFSIFSFFFSLLCVFVCYVFVDVYVCVCVHARWIRFASSSSRFGFFFSFKREFGVVLVGVCPHTGPATLSSSTWLHSSFLIMILWFTGRLVLVFTASWSRIDRRKYDARRFDS